MLGRVGEMTFWGRPAQMLRARWKISTIKLYVCCDKVRQSTGALYEVRQIVVCRIVLIGVFGTFDTQVRLGQSTRTEYLAIVR